MRLGLRNSVNRVPRIPILGGGGGAPNPAFQIRVKTDNPGVTSNNQFRINTDSGYTYDYRVDWGDGNVDANQTGNITHTYSSPGEYDISITGTFPRLLDDSSGDAPKIIEVKNWGSIAFSDLARTFDGCSNLTTVSATDTPNIENVINMGAMFRDCTSLTSMSLSGWLIPAAVTNFGSMFSGCSSLETLWAENIDVSNIEIFSGMFDGTSSLTSIVGIEDWDVSSATSMLIMFRNSAVDPDISQWNPESCTDFVNIFAGNSWSIENYDKMLIAWDELPLLQSGKTFSAPLTKYSSGAAATSRSNIISDWGWSFTDDGQL